MGRSMMAGAVASLAYCLVVSFAIDHLDLPGWLVAVAAWAVWLIVAFGLWGIFLR
jgi:hypothetical protein